MDERFDAIPFLVLLEEDERNLADEIHLLDDLPSDALPRASVDDIRGIDVEVIDEAVFLFPHIVAPSYGDQVFVLIPSRVNLITLAFGKHSNLNVRRIVRIAENTEQHRAFGLRSGDAFALAEFAVEVSALDNILKFLERPICPCGLLRPFHRTAVEEYECDFIDVNLIRYRQLPYRFEPDEIPLFVGNDLVLPLHDFMGGYFILFERGNRHIHTVVHALLDRRNIFGGQQLLKLLISSYKSIEIIAKQIK